MPDTTSLKRDRDTVKQFVAETAEFIDPDTVGVVLDVGSRDAIVALALKEHFRNAAVYAFECNPAAIEICRKNIEGHKDVTLVEKAVSDAEGVIDFYVVDGKQTEEGAGGNIGASSIYAVNPEYPYEKLPQTRIQVEAITIGAWAKKNHIRAIDLVWMDLQGAELRAIRGMQTMIRTTRIIYTEVEYKPVYLGQPLFKDIDQELVKNGFRLHKVMNSCDWFADAMYVRKWHLPMIARQICTRLKRRLKSAP